MNYKEIYTGSGYLFADSEMVATWAARAVEGAKVLGIINGKGNNVFDDNIAI